MSNAAKTLCRRWRWRCSAVQRRQDAAAAGTLQSRHPPPPLEAAVARRHTGFRMTINLHGTAYVTKCAIQVLYVSDLGTSFRSPSLKCPEDLKGLSVSSHLLNNLKELPLRLKK